MEVIGVLGYLEEQVQEVLGRSGAVVYAGSADQDGGEGQEEVAAKLDRLGRTLVEDGHELQGRLLTQRVRETQQRRGLAERGQQEDLRGGGSEIKRLDRHIQVSRLYCHMHSRYSVGKEKSKAPPTMQRNKT